MGGVRTMHTKMDRTSRSNRYYRNAVERHWDPGAIDLSRDVAAYLESPLLEIDLEALGFEDGIETVFDDFRRSIAKFGAGEDAVTEDLAPLAVVLEDFDDQLFLTTQLYDESRHADFFDRYWHEVIHPLEDELGFERSDPRDERWFDDAYLELFERNEAATHLLLEADTPENRALAFCHYHVTIEGILAQSGYYGIQTLLCNEDLELLPALPGLGEGIAAIRGDEGRHVGFGMAKLKDLLRNDLVDAPLIEKTLEELAGLVVDSLSGRGENDVLELASVPDYAEQKYQERLAQVLDASTDVPDGDELTAIEG